MKRVIFKDSNGSIGTIDDIPQSNDRIYVVWNYGKSANGEYITSSSWYSIEEAKKKFMEISEEIYQEFVNCRAWSEEQNIIRVKIVGPQFDSSKNCRECEFWAADPDGEYCAHPDAVKHSSFGINLARARGNLSYKPDKPQDDPAHSICGPEGKLWKERSSDRKLKR